MNNIIPIFLACDDKYFKFTAVTMKSIIENANEKFRYKFYILNIDISNKNKEIGKSLLKENFDIEFVDVASYFDSIREDLPIRDYYNKTTYFRFFIAEMFKELDKAIYIDSDITVVGDISKFYNVDLGNNLLGACNEQAMVQLDLFGTYVENNLGLDRNKFFNAGNILINTKLFRDECVLDQFLNLLNVYECRVTQDEDYLNIICNNRVKWIDNSWNVECYNDLKILYNEDTANAIHFLMWGKPWKYDSKFSPLFWKYAKMTPYYDEIKAIRDSITEEVYKKDLEGYKGLEELAKEEIKREDTFVAMKKKLGIKSVSRLQVLKKIREYERTARFSEDVENDPPSRELKPGEVDYTKKKFKSKFKTRLAYFFARRYLNKLNRKKLMIVKDIVGKENLSNLTTGAVITCNHFNALDSFAIQMAYEASVNKRKKKFYRVIREGNYTSFPGFYGFLMRNCYTLPLSNNKTVMLEFARSTNKLLNDGHLVLFYPEQSMWWNYRKPKPLQKGAFQFAVANNVPIVPIFITMRDSDLLDKDGFNIQEYTIHIEKPIYPDKNKTKSENVEMLKTQNFLLWKDLYEKTYNTKLHYDSIN